MPEFKTREEYERWKAEKAKESSVKDENTDITVSSINDIPSMDPKLNILKTNSSISVKKDNNFSDFIDFKKMILPDIIKITYWILTFLLIISGVITFIFSFGKSEIMTIGGLGITLLLLVLLRIFAECAIIFFKINETLIEIKDILERR